MTKKGAKSLKPRIEDIPIGVENAISRADLKRLCNCDDRTVRDRIARLRAEDNGDNYVIVSHSRGSVKGYYRSDKADEIRHFVNETNKRIASTRKPLAKAERVLKEVKACAEN